MSDIDTQLDEIIASIAGDVYDYADGVVGGRDEAVYSAAQSHKRALEALIAQQVKEAVDLEKSLRAKTGTERYKDGIQDGLQMALYGTQDGSKEEKFIRHLLYSESIEKYNG